MHAECAPTDVSFRADSDAQDSLFSDPVQALAPSHARSAPKVPRAFFELGADVACHRDPSRWALLYRALWRLTHGEPHLLDVFVDDDVHALQQMSKAIRREGHKLRAFVRFRLVGEGTDAERYVAWFEPEHDVVCREAPFFARRFPSMRWSILTPLTCAHWDGATLSYGEGVSRLDAPSGDVLEDLWRTYYANIFNPARVSVQTMRAEMPARYWKHLPEAPLIAPLVREAPTRVREMIARQQSADSHAERRRLADAQRRAATGAPETDRRDARHPAMPALAHASHVRQATLTHVEPEGPPHDEGARVARERSARARRILAERGVDPYGGPVDGASVRVGTASWTDPTMIAAGVFYPEGVANAHQRLAYYASRFSFVEVDATYYALPSARVAELWAARTPDGFTFDVKAHALMTGHATHTARLPADIRAALPASLAQRDRIRSGALPDELLDEVWRRFISALAPLAQAGKLGALLLQLPRDFIASEVNEQLIARMRERCGDILGAIEFRHASWLTGDDRRERTLALLRELGLVFVMTDAPPGFVTSMPRVCAVTSDRLAILRFHGRRTETWETPVAVTSERYRYLYDARELGSWVPDIIDVAQRTQGVHVVMNNCHANYGTSNGDEISALLVEADLERRRMYRERIVLRSGAAEVASA